LGLIRKGEFLERGYCSISFNKEIAREKAKYGWVMEIYAPKGTNGSYLKPYSKNPIELEYLLPRNIKFKITYTNLSNKILRVIII
jgi:hypothetical protein